MGKQNKMNGGRRATKKNTRKEKFKKKGKNTTKGIRIKEKNMERNSKKKEGDNNRIKFLKSTNNKGKHGAATAKAVCKITCKNK